MSQTGQPQELRHSPRYDLDSVRHGMAELKKRWDNRLILNKLDIAKEYVRGNLCVILEGKTGIVERTIEGEGLAGLEYEGIAVEFGEAATYCSAVGHDHQLIGRWGVNDWRQGGVLVRPIETVCNVEEVTRAAGERLNRLKPLFDGGRCFYGPTKSFVTGPINPFGEVELIVLAAIVEANDLPQEVIERGPQVVNSIAYCQGDFWRRGQDGDGDVHLPVVRLSDRFIKILPREGGKLPFKISNVMIGPFDL